MCFACKCGRLAQGNVVGLFRQILESIGHGLMFPLTNPVGNVFPMGFFLLGTVSRCVKCVYFPPCWGDVFGKVVSSDGR